MAVTLTLTLGDETLVDHASYADAPAARRGALTAMSVASASRPGCFGRWRVQIEPEETAV